MNSRAVLILFVFSAFRPEPAHADGAAPHPLAVTAAIPVVNVERHPPGRHFLSLPTLEYAFEVETHCGDNTIPASLSISIADSRKSLSTAELEGNGSREVLLTVPARQIAPIAVNEFCVIEAGGAGGPDAATEISYAPVAIAANPDRITVGAALSAQISLLCSSDSDSGRKITYVTQPLDVTLTCAIPASSGADAGQQDTGNR